MRYLSNFLAEFRGGFQRSARYECSLFVPPTLLSSLLTPGIIGIIDVLVPTVGQFLDKNFAMQNIAQWLARGLLVDSARLPSRAMETATLQMYGIAEQFPYSSEYTGFDCTFMMPLVASDNAVPRFFNFWQNHIQNQQNGPESGCDFRWPADYYGTMFLSLFDNQDHPTCTYRFDNVYPKTVNSVEVAWTSSNEFAALGVGFAYSYWKMLPYQPPPIIDINIQF